MAVYPGQAYPDGQTPPQYAYAYPGQAYPNAEAPGRLPTFTPPHVRRHVATPELWNRPFHKMNMDFAQTVLKSTSGAYTTVTNPTPEQIAAAAVAYLGGYTYVVTPQEANALAAAGYTVN